MPKLTFNTVLDGWKEAAVPIKPAPFVQPFRQNSDYRQTDRQTERQTQGRCYIVAALAQRRAGETPGGVSVIPGSEWPKQQ